MLPQVEEFAKLVVCEDDDPTRELLVDPVTRSASVGDREVRLANKEFAPNPHSKAENGACGNSVAMHRRLEKQDRGRFLER